MKPLRGETLLFSKPAVALPNPQKNPDTSTEDGQRWREGGRHQPAWGAAPLGAHLPASPCKPFRGLTLISPAIACSFSVRTKVSRGS